MVVYLFSSNLKVEQGKPASFTKLAVVKAFQA